MVLEEGPKFNRQIMDSLHKHYLPSDWEEQWRKEKERRTKSIEEGDEEKMKRDRTELRRIVEYNNARMGLPSTEFKRDMGGMSEEGFGSSVSEEALQNERRVARYHSTAHPCDVFSVLKTLQESHVLTDLCLVARNNESIDVHAPILASVSSYIRKKLKDEVNGQANIDTDAHVCLKTLCLGPDVEYAGLLAVVEFAYTGATALSFLKDSVDSTRTAAQTLGVSRLVELCDRGVERLRKKDEEEVQSLENMKINLQSIKLLWNDKVGCDITLDLDETSFQGRHFLILRNPFFHFNSSFFLFTVHKVIIAASSDFFHGMFTCGMRESQQSHVVLPFLAAPELEALICYSYSGTLQLSWNCVFEVTCLALQLQFRTALSLCLDFMKQEMDATSCLDVASFAEAYGMSELLEEANDYILRNFWDVSHSVKFPDLPPEKLLDILRCDGLCVPSELAVFRAVSTWIEADPEQRLAQAALLMSGVRFPFMTFREFREVRAINLRMECLGNKDVNLYSSALQEFAFSKPQTNTKYRVRHPKNVVILVGGDQLNPDSGQHAASREVWFANSLRSGIGLVKEVEWRKLSEIPEKPKFRHGIATLKGLLYVAGGCYFYTKNDIMKSAYRLITHTITTK